ncbi:MAG: polysaccharide biosynthesis protein [Candidatus Puniceispirillaceae bacterium]
MIAPLLSQARALPRRPKQLIVVSIDAAMAIAAMWLAYTLRLEEWHMPNQTQFISYGLAMVGSIAIFYQARLYHIVFSYLTITYLVSILRAVAIYSAGLFLLLVILQLPTVPRSVGLIQPFIFLVLVCINRIIISALAADPISSIEAKQYLIYGAGKAGAQLLQGLRDDHRTHIVGFIDDDGTRVGRSLLDRPIFHASDLPDLIERYHITDILVAMPSVSPMRRREIVDRLLDLNLSASTVPSLSDILADQKLSYALNPLALEDILPRRPLSTSDKQNSLKDKVVMVTGAGGSIGSEICRQILLHGPRKLVLVDNSEFNLYRIDAALRAILENNAQDVAITSCLCSVTNQERLQHIFTEHAPQTIYHAAAYKHVPILEDNPTEAIVNNFVGTRIMADLAIAHKAERFVLISTDKAVRPTNIMGASKRLAEMVVQSRADSQSQTLFCMVRFGNVIGSSGSALPLFQHQIANGGPVTVTHPDITRYFMSIPEAASLVLEAGEMSTGGEMFVLDMGSQVKILDLVHRMVRIMGKTVKSAETPNGDIEIAFIGLRPGEKMYEELVLGDNIQTTSNDRINMAVEDFLETTALSACEDRLTDAGTLVAPAIIETELITLDILQKSAE